MLFSQDAPRERVSIAGFQDRYGALENNDAVVEMLVDEMHCTACDLDAEVEGLPLRVEPRKGREQRRMDIENAVWEGGDELGRQQAHVPGQANQLNAMRAQAGNHVGIVHSARASLGDEDFGGKSQLARLGKAFCFGDIRDHNGDLRAFEPSLADRFGNRNKVRSAAGEQNAEADRRVVGIQLQMEFPRGLKLVPSPTCIGPGGRP